MGIERLKSVKDQIMCAVEGQIHNLSETDTKEMGEAIDMLKDLSEAIYYCTVTESMEEASEEDKKHYMNKYLPETAMYYTPVYYAQRRNPSNGRYMYTEPKWDDEDYKYRERMYYSSMNNGSSGNSGSNNSMNYTHDYREGNSGMSRRTYVELKENGEDKNKTNQELENYMNDLSNDMSDLIKHMDASEKTLLKQKLATLASKIV